jgi:hypothetical protein
MKSTSAAMVRANVAGEFGVHDVGGRVQPSAATPWRVYTTGCGGRRRLPYPGPRPCVTLGPGGRRAVRSGPTLAPDRGRVSTDDLAVPVTHSRMPHAAAAIPDEAGRPRDRVTPPDPPSGERLVRLGPGDLGWLVEFRQILLRSATDFLRRAKMAGTPEGMLEELAGSLAQPQRAVWLVPRPDYRLLGFAIAEVSASFGGPLAGVGVATYLYPRRRIVRKIFPALVHAMATWAATQSSFMVFSLPVMGVACI